MSRRVWDEGVMQWRRQKATGSWVEDNPPLPKWAKESSGFVPAARFIRMWSAAASLSALKQELFWMGLEDIESQAMLLSDWLEDRGFESLPPKLLWEDAPLSQDALAALVDEGLVVVAAPEGEPSDAAAHEPVSEAPAPAQPEPRAVAAVLPETTMDLTPEPARPDEDPDRDYVPFSMQHPSGDVGVGVQKFKKP